MQHLQHIAVLGTVLEELGARHVIISPGSRNAPLMQLFTARESFQCHSIVDERSAAYVALGMSRELAEPVVLVTTSGTAVLNLAPALAEAHQQQIPLVVLTADRPRELISQFNNQCCDQRSPYFNFSKGFYEIPAYTGEKEDLEKSMTAVRRLFREAISAPQGPVHVNLPLTEPLYEKLPEAMNPPSTAWMKPLLDPGLSGTSAITAEAGKKVLILAGMGRRDRDLQKALEEFPGPVVAENISNLSPGNSISMPELVLAGASETEKLSLAPDAVLAFGQQVVSKRLKIFLQSLGKLKVVELREHGAIIAALGKLASSPFLDREFGLNWKRIEDRECIRTEDYLRRAPFGNLSAVFRIMESVPSRTVVHLGNSATIRYSQLMRVRPDLQYYSNRGISGIDGSLSTAVGAAMVSGLQHLLVLGDLSFVYDSNGMWNKDFPENLRIIVLNDGGGGIFRLLDGPDRMAFFEEFSVTHHPVSLELLSGAFGRRAARAAGFEDLEKHLPALWAPGQGLSVLEVDTTKSDNSRIFKDLFK